MIDYDESLSSYGPLAAYYDLLMEHVDYEGWVSYALQRLGLPQKASLPAEGGGEPPLILDLACGTGTIAVALARRGYRVVGVDRSEEMLAVADEKARRAGVKVLWTLQDMRRFQLAEQADAAVCLFDSLNYLVDEGDLERAFRQTAAALKPGALMVFDLHTESRLREYGESLFVDSGEEVAYIWENEYDEELRLCTMAITLFVRDGDGRYTRYDEVHLERAFTPAEVEAALKRTGFELLGVYGELSQAHPTPDEGRIFYVVRRTG